MIEAVGAASIVLILGFIARPQPPVRTPSASAIEIPAVSYSTNAALRWGRLGRRTRPAVIDAAEVAAWCEALARLARGGSTLGGAIRTAATPASCDATVGSIVLALERGRALGDALDIRSDSAHLTLALSVLRACSVNGGPPAEPIDRAAATLRARANAAAERRTQSAQARLSAVVMTVLPAAMLALLLVTSSTTRQAVASSLGAGAVFVGAALNLIGWRWMNRIIVGRPT